MTEYHKIETLFDRDGKFVVTEQLRNPVYGAFKKWHVTEKVDGTNIVSARSSQPRTPATAPVERQYTLATSRDFPGPGVFLT